MAYTNADIKSIISTSAKSRGQDPNVMLAIAEQESNFNPNVGASDIKTQSTGLFQILPSTWSGLVKDGLISGDYSTDPKAQANAASALMQQLASQFKGDLKAQLVAYNAGPQTAKRFRELTKQGWSDAEANKQAVLEAGKGDGNYLAKVGSKAAKNGTDKAIATTGGSHIAGLASTTEPSTSATFIEEDPATDYIPLTSDAIEESTLSNLNDRGLFDPTGLDETPWYEDKNLLVGNPHLKSVPTPVSFTINLREFSTPLMISQGNPLTIKLNCSLDQLTVNMKHIVNKSNTRTGFHMTFWGMEPDTISGSGSTGVFMNQFGVTDLMSLASTPDELFDAAEEAGQGAALYNTPSKSRLRVAAQDAFIELLSLFRNNGITRYKRDNYTGSDSVTINRDQLERSVWSEKYGDSTYTKNARNNDVMVKGNVVMKYKSNYYHGYFKSLSWIIDSDNPFQWKFDFTFQVQKTVSFVFYPKV